MKVDVWSPFGANDDEWTPPGVNKMLEGLGRDGDDAQMAQLAMARESMEMARESMNAESDGEMNGLAITLTFAPNPYLEPNSLELVMRCHHHGMGMSELAEVLPPSGPSFKEGMDPRVKKAKEPPQSTPTPPLNTPYPPTPSPPTDISRTLTPPYPGHPLTLHPSPAPNPLYPLPLYSLPLYPRPLHPLPLYPHPLYPPPPTPPLPLPPFPGDQDTTEEGPISDEEYRAQTNLLLLWPFPSGRR